MKSLLCKTFFLGAVFALMLSCDKPVAAPLKRAATTSVRIASLVPAATDLLVGMNAADHLVAISNWDVPRPEFKDLPMVGDYRDVNWEQLITLKPDAMIVQFAPDKMPAGLMSRADELGIKLVNVRINRLDDVFGAIDQLGEAVNEPSKAQTCKTQLQATLDIVKRSVSGKPRVRTLIVRAESSLACVGGGNFLDDLLTLAGGENVLGAGDNSYPTIDREQLIKLNPDVILQLLPGASEQSVALAKQFWPQVNGVAAVMNARVYILTDSYLLLPGFSVGKIAQDFAASLHRTSSPAPTTATTRGSS